VVAVDEQMSWRVTLITTGLVYCGAETQLVRIALSLRQRGWKMGVVSMLPPEAYVEELETAGIKVDSLDMRPGCPDPRSLFRLARILREQRPHVVSSFLVHANILARMTRPLARVPVLVSSARNVNEKGSNGSSRWRDLAYRLTDHLCDMTVQNSKAGLKRYVEMRAAPRQRIVHIPNGLDLALFRPDAKARSRVRQSLGLGDAFVWLAVGRLEEQKDYPTMLRAFSRAVREFPGVLLIVGHGSLKGEVEKLAKELGVAERVRLLGIRKDVAALMNAADAFVMSSAWEGLPNVLIEASAIGLPAVATDVGGSSEVLLDRETGFLVPPKNPQVLAATMLRLMVLPEGERRHMGQRARQFVEQQYALGAVVDRWEALYRDLLVRKGHWSN
jgi:glycosyltransferase involved in cell wall biosynthesis